MRKCFLFCCLFITIAVSAQSWIGAERTSNLFNEKSSMKVKKERTNKMGIMVKSGMASFSLDGWDCKSEIFGQVFFTYGGPIKPRNPECRWAFETGVGLDFYSGKARYSKGRYDEDEDILMIGLFTIPVKVKYILNPLSIRGKWNLNAGIDFCPLLVGIPTDEKIKKTSYHHLSSGDVGLKLNAEIGVGYETNHWGFSIGGFAGLTTPYSADAEKGSGPTMVGFYASLQYLF